MVVFLVDAHPAYQAKLNVEALAREGYRGLVVKATKGTGTYWAPATFDEWITRARAAGMVPGAYHWLTNGDPVTQVELFLHRLETVGGPGGLLIQLDCEDTRSPASAGTITRWIAEWQRRTDGHPLFFYSGRWWYLPHLGGFRVADLGVHSWNGHHVHGSGCTDSLYQEVPPQWWDPGYGGFDRSRILRFSDQASTAGLAARVDANAFDGTIQELRAFTGSGR